MTTATRPDDELTTAVRAFRQNLRTLYQDPRVAEEAFRAAVQSQGIARARQALQEHPGHFGQLRPGVQPSVHVEHWAALRNAAHFGAQAHQLNLARTNPHLQAELLRQRLEQQTIRMRSDGTMIDPSRFLQKWDQSVRALGLETAAQRLHDQPRAFGLNVNSPAHGEASASISELATAASAAAKSAPAARVPLSDLPADVGRATYTEAQQQVLDAKQMLARLDTQDRIATAARSDMRTAFKQVYADPVAAEKSFRDALQGGPAKIEAALHQLRENPSSFGELAHAPRSGLAGKAGLSTSDSARAAAPAAADAARKSIAADRDLREPITFRGAYGRFEVRTMCDTVIAQATRTQAELKPAVLAARHVAAPAPSLTPTPSR